MDACETIIKRLNEYLPEVKDAEILSTKQWVQEVSGNTGTIFELDLGKFTQEELVNAFETVVRIHQVQQSIRIFGL